MTTPARQELRDLIVRAVTSAIDEFGPTPDRIADALMAPVHTVGDEWESIDISTVGDEPGSRLLDQRWLVARIPRQATERVRKADRSVSP